MNNLLSYCGLVDARISASEKYLPVLIFYRYDSFNIKNDIALIKLKNPVDFTKGSVGTVCLPNEYNGFGKIESLLSQPTIIGT